jgi:hypothetical protein
MKYYPILDFLLSLFGLNSHFTVIVENMTKDSKKVTLFGANELALKHNYGFPDGIKVSVKWWGYKRLMKKIILEPFYVSGMTIKSRYYLQIQQAMSIESVNVRTQQSASLPLFPKNYVSNYQEEENYANIYPYGLKFDEQLRMHLTILPKERVQLIFTKGENKIPTLPKDSFSPNINVLTQPQTAL